MSLKRQGVSQVPKSAKEPNSSHVKNQTH